MSEQYLVCRSAFYNCYYEKVGKEVKNINDEIPFEIPDSWVWARFPSIVDFKLGKTPERHNQDYWNDAKYPWVSIADMKEKETIYETKERISENALNKCFKSTLSSSGTLIMSFKLTVGRVSILGMDAVHNEAIISIIPIYDKDNSIKNWLFNILGIITNLADQTDAIKGSTLNKDKLSSLLIPIPSIGEQQRIISKLYSFESLLKEYEEKEKQLTNLESSFESRLKASILQYAIEGKLVKQDPNDEPASVLLERIKAEKEKLIKEGKIKRDKNESEIVIGDDKNYYEKVLFDNIPCGWAVTRIGTISESYIGLTYKPCDISDCGTIVLRSSNIKNGKLNLDDIVRVNIQINQKLMVGVNDILICARNGSKKLVGKSALITRLDEPMTFGAFMAICKSKFSKYIFIFLQSSYFFTQLNKTSGTTTINQLTQKAFNSFLIPLPPFKEQQRISKKLKRLMYLTSL